MRSSVKHNFYWNLITSHGGIEDSWHEVCVNFDSYLIKRFNEKCIEVGLPIVLTLVKKVDKYIGDEGGWTGYYVFKFNDDLFRMDGYFDSWCGESQNPEEFWPAKEIQIPDWVFIDE